MAVLLNVTEDHLDRHGTFEAYRDAKLRVFANQDAGAAWRSSPPGVEVPGSARPRSSSGGLAAAGRGDPPARSAQPGERHGSVSGCDGDGCAEEAVAAALRSFPGVPHRLEEVGSVGGVLYVNDSKATNVASAVRGIEAFDGGVHVILGGSLKGGGFEGLRDAVASRCVAAYLIGEAAERLEQDLAGTVPLHRCGDLAAAVRDAAAQPGEVVLLSPACASFDQFRGLRGAWRGLQVVGPAGMNPGLARRKPDACGCRRKRPVEYSILYTATLCLLAGGAVMVYSASSAESLLSGPGIRRTT